MPADMNAPRPIPLRPDPGALRAANIATLVRAAAACAICAVEERPVHDAMAIATRTWHDNHEVIALIRAATAPTTSDSASDLVTTALADFLVSLAPMSASATLIARELSLRFDGAGAISVPGVVAPAGSFVREGEAIPVAQGQTGGPRLEPNAVKVIVTFSKELFSGTPYNLEASIGAALAKSTGASLDASMLSTDPAVPGLRPGGLLDSITPLPPSSLSPPSEAMIDDLAMLAGAVAPVASNGSIVYVAAAKQAAAANLRLPKPLAYPVMSSANLAPGTIICVAANTLVSALDPIPRIQTGTQGAFHERYKSMADR